jgi:aquaporin Z
MAAVPVNWREYLIEAWGLGTFMVSAAVMTTLLEHPASPVRQAVPDAFVRRVWMGLAMGLTAGCLIYSPWGQRSGAHFNPSVTLTFLRLGKVSARDASWYIAAQFAGGTLGIWVAALLLAPWIASPAVNYVATLPGPGGEMVAFAAEAGISFLLMIVVLTVSNAPALSRYTGVAAGLLVAAFIAVEAPLSGMSMNPARTLGPDVVGQITHGLWLYFAAPPLGMLAASEAYRRLPGLRAVHCAKLHHGRGRCVFNCGFDRIGHTS